MNERGAKKFPGTTTRGVESSRVPSEPTDMEKTFSTECVCQYADCRSEHLLEGIVDVLLRCNIGNNTGTTELFKNTLSTGGSILQKSPRRI